MSRRLQLTDQNPLRSLFFLIVSLNQSLGFGKPLPRKVNSSDFRVSGFSDEACGKHGKHGF
jgi:hypothetical protein